MADRKKILLVEDDEELRSTLKSTLRRQYEVLEAGDGERAVAQVLDHRPDLILLDLLLPKLDGFKVLERVRSYPDKDVAKTPVIVFSNLYSEKDILQVQGLKVEEFFVKAHTHMDEVITRINKVFEPVAAV